MDLQAQLAQLESEAEPEADAEQGLLSRHSTLAGDTKAIAELVASHVKLLDHQPPDVVDDARSALLEIQHAVSDMLTRSALSDR